MTAAPNDPGRDHHVIPHRDAPDHDERRDAHLLAALAQAPDALDGPPAALTAALQQAARNAVAPAAPQRPRRARWAWLDIWRQPVWATGLTAVLMATLVLGLWWQPHIDSPDGALPAIADTRVAEQAVDTPAPRAQAEAAPASAGVTPSIPAAPAPAPAPAVSPTPRSLAVPARPKSSAERRPAPRSEPPAPKAEAASPLAESSQVPVQAPGQARAAPSSGAAAPLRASSAEPSPVSVAPAPPPAATAAPSPAALAQPSTVHPPPPQLAELIDRLREATDAKPASVAAQTDAVIAERKRATEPSGVLAKLQGSTSAWRWTPPGSGGEPVTAGSDAAVWLQRLRDTAAGRWQPQPASAVQLEALSRPTTVVTFNGGSTGPIRITLSGDTAQWQDAQGAWQAP
jgi:hypothetical protein